MAKSSWKVILTILIILEVGLGRICKSDKNVFKNTFFSIVRYFKIILLLLFCAYFDSCDVRGTPNLTLKLFSFFQFNKMSFCWKISHPFPKANLCPIFDRVWARLKKKKKKRGREGANMDAMKPFWCFFVVAILSEGHAQQNQTFSQFEY